MLFCLRSLCVQAGSKYFGWSISSWASEIINGTYSSYDIPPPWLQLHLKGRLPNRSPAINESWYQEQQALSKQSSSALTSSSESFSSSSISSSSTSSKLLILRIVGLPSASSTYRERKEISVESSIKIPVLLQICMKKMECSESIDLIGLTRQDPAKSEELFFLDDSLDLSSLQRDDSLFMAYRPKPTISVEVIGCRTFDMFSSTISMPVMSTAAMLVEKLNQINTFAAKKICLYSSNPVLNKDSFRLDEDRILQHNEQLFVTEV
jgi:hypothetical protein